jgi:hypothetical protein
LLLLAVAAMAGVLRGRPLLLLLLLLLFLVLLWGCSPAVLFCPGGFRLHPRRPRRSWGS